MQAITTAVANLGVGSSISTATPPPQTPESALRGIRLPDAPTLPAKGRNELRSLLCKAWSLHKPTRFEGWLLNTAKWLGEDATLEEVILEAITAPKCNHHRTPVGEIHGWLRRAGRERMLAAGEPLPSAEPFTLYRGVSGVGRQRRPNGVSWTDSLDVARFFQDRFYLENPAIVTMTFAAEHVYAYTNERKEREFVVIVPGSVRPRRRQRS